MAGLKTPVVRAAFQKTLVDQNDTDNIYIGRARVASATNAAVWQIILITTDVSNVVSFLYANGSPSASNIWDNRVSLSYS